MKEDRFHQGDNVPAGIVSGTDDGHMDGLTLFHSWLLPTLRAVTCHNASSQILTVPCPLLHGVGLGVVPTVVSRALTLGQAELPAQSTVFLLNFSNTHFQALPLPLAGGCVPGTVGLGLQGRQRHRFPIFKAPSKQVNPGDGWYAE